MSIKVEFTIPAEELRAAVRAELDAAMPDLVARLLAATAVQTGTVPAPVVEQPKAPVEAAPAPVQPAPAPAEQAAPIAPVLRLVSQSATTVVTEIDPVAGATQTRLFARVTTPGAAPGGWASNGRTEGFRFSKGGLAAGSYDLRLQPLDANGAAVGLPSTIISVTVGATATPTPAPTPATPAPSAPPPAPTTGTRAMRDASKLPSNLALPYQVPTLPATVRVRSLDAAAAAPVQHGHDFGPGDVPATHRLRLRTADGTSIPLQVDAESRWADGSLRFAVLSYYAPSLAAGEEKALTLDAVEGKQDRTPWISLADLAKARDLALRASGWTWGADAGVLRLRDAVAQGKPDQPAGGIAYLIETKASGPHRVEYRICAPVRRERDGAAHESVCLDFYLTAWRNGELETLAWQVQPNGSAPHAGATWKTVAWNEPNVGQVELLEGDKRLWVLGGPDDRDARTVGPESWDVAQDRYLVPIGQNIGQASGIGDPDRGGWNGGGVPFGVAGALPGGLSASKPYWTKGFNLYESGSPAKRWVDILGRRNGGDVDKVDLTSAPAGGTRTFPLVQSHPGGGAILADASGDPFWTASYPRPRVRVALDLEYHCRAGRLIAPMDLTVPCGNQPPGHDAAEWPAHPHRPNQVYIGSVWDTGFQGDDWHADRIGPWSRQSINWLFTPYDEVRRAHALALAGYDADIPYRFDDPRSGKAFPVGTKAYPGLGAPIPNLYMTYRPGQGTATTPGFAAMDWGNKDVTGYVPRYDPVNDGSHIPQYQLIPYLLTGRSYHLDIMRSRGASLLASHHAGIRQRRFVDPKTGAVREFSLILNDQYRAQGWANLWFSNLVHLLPEGHPEKAYFADAARENAEYLSLLAPHSPWKEFGVVPHGPDSGEVADYTSENAVWGNGINAGFQNGFLASCVAMGLYRGEAAWKPAFEVMLRYIRDSATAPNGHPAFSGIYFANFARGDQEQDPGQLLYKTTLEWARGEWKRQTGSEPFPAFGNFAGSHASYGDRKVDPGPSDFITSYEAPQLATLALADRLGFPGCAEARLGIIAQTMATPDGVKLPRDRYIFGTADQPEQLGMRWAWASRAM